MVEQGSKLSLYLTTIPITEGWAVDSEMSPICHMGMLQDDVISLPAMIVVLNISTSLACSLIITLLHNPRPLLLLGRLLDNYIT